jgi:hypothetical protein
VADAVLILACLIRPSRRLHWASLKKYVIGVSAALLLCMAGQDRQIPETAQQTADPVVAQPHTSAPDPQPPAPEEKPLSIVKSWPPPVQRDVPAPQTETASTSAHSLTENPAPSGSPSSASPALPSFQWCQIPYMHYSYTSGVNISRLDLPLVTIQNGSQTLSMAAWGGHGTRAVITAARLGGCVGDVTVPSPRRAKLDYHGD